MTERVARLRECSLNTKASLSLERAALLTAFYRESGPLSVPVLRAKSLEYVMEHRSIYIGPEELLVGERGPRPKATPTYPELCCHTMDDFQVLDTREKISYCVDDEARRIQREEIIPYWQGHSMRDRIFAEMEPSWKDAYEAGIFTEFMEQRAPGHTVLGDVIYRKGLLDLKREVAESLARLDFFNDPLAYDKQQELKAMAVAADAVIGSRSGTPKRPNGWRRRNQTRGARRNWSGSRMFAGMCPHTLLGTSRRRCKRIGSST